MIKFCLSAAALVLAAAAARAPAQTRGASQGYELIPGTFDPGRGPDGNSVFLDAPEGLILVDTGRHPAHVDKLLSYARAKGKPIVAIFNTHWHLDHSTGNAEIRSAYPNAKLYASNAIEGALKGFLAKSRVQTEQFLRSGKATADQQAEIRRAFAVMDNPASLRPTDPITASARVTVAGRPLTVNLAPFAATEADVWIYDGRAKLAIVGDLVVAMVPFMDTACPEGWRAALDAIAATPFTTLIPGHGEPIGRDQFMIWRTAYNNLLDCAASDKAASECIHGWKRDAAAFIPAGETRVEAMLGYYIETRLRAKPEERRLHCAAA